MLPFLSPRSPNSMLGMCHGILPKFVSALFKTLNWGGGGGGDKFCTLFKGIPTQIVDQESKIASLILVFKNEFGSTALDHFDVLMLLLA